MKGLFIWAHSYCRSTLGFYKGLGTALSVPVKIIVLNKMSDARKTTGFSNSEFEDMDISEYNGFSVVDHLLKEYNDYFHLFGSYHDAISRSIIDKAISSHIRFGIASEAPCNMMPYPKRFLKDLYVRFILPIKVHNVTKHANFIINYSGDDSEKLKQIGWDKHKIIPCGYYSPAIVGSKNIKRTKAHWEKFTILLSGIHEWHRSPFVLLKALKILDERGVQYECNITQKGPLYDSMLQYIKDNTLKHVHLLGFLPMKELIEQYQNCSIYIGAGNNEPWGMRLNDVLQCGAPLIVNLGMGGNKLVNDYSCGLTFDKNNHIQLADKIELLINDYKLYQNIADAAYSAAISISPYKKAEEIIAAIIQKTSV